MPEAGADWGFTLIELLFVVGLLTVAAAAAVPQLQASVDTLRGRAAARYLAGRMMLARALAVRDGAAVALRFVDHDNGISFAVFQDGNRNGVRAADIDLGVDRLVEAPVRLGDLFPGTAIALVPGTPAAEAVTLGGSDLLSFTPSGTSTSGTIYIRGRDGTQWAVRVLGATARVRVLRYAPRSGEWVETL
jgi:type II secretory pathway pseudopilin PulG